MPRSFSLTEAQEARVKEFEEIQDKIVAIEQGLDRPYYGAIGGHLSYVFSPNSIGLHVKVVHGGTGEELDITSYEDW